LTRWLSQFDDHIALSLLYFLTASGVALLIALVTVAGVAFAGASTEPGKALRYE
jgi:putative ABC transport system permease protein